MIDLHFSATPNGQKIAIMLEECRFDHRVIPYDIFAGDQLTPELGRINPNHKLPAIVDRDPSDGTEPVTVFESGAILQYLAEKSGRFLPSGGAQRARVLSWLTWQVAGLGPMGGQASHFLRYAPEGQDYATNRYTRELERLLTVLEGQLSEHAYVAGADYSIADMAVWPWVLIAKPLGQPLDDFPHVARWRGELKARPAVRAGVDLGKENRRSAPPDEAERRVLFGRRGDAG